MSIIINYISDWIQDVNLFFYGKIVMVYSYNSKKTTLHVPSIDGCDSFLQSLDINHFPYKTSHHNLLTITLKHENPN